IEPMKARLVDEPPKHGDWLYELKFDGIRAMAIKNDRKVSLVSRNGNKLDGRFPEIVEAVKNLPVREYVIDGEVVALDEDGRSSFQLYKGSKWKDEKRRCAFTSSTCSNSTAKVCSGFRSNSANKSSPRFAKTLAIQFATPAKSAAM